MIDRQPDQVAARAAAAYLDRELEFEPEISDAPPSSTQPGPSRSAIAGSRAQLVTFGSMLVLNLSTSAAKRWGAQWVYSQPECEAVASATLDVADLYLDELDGPWTNLAIVLLATALPRMLGPKLSPLVDEISPTASPASSSPPEKAAA